MKNRAYGIARNHNYDWCQRALAPMVYRFFDKKNRMKNSYVILQLAEEFHKPVTKNSKEGNSMQDLKTIFGQQIYLK